MIAALLLTNMEVTTMSELEEKKVPLTKVCKGCGRELPIEKFGKHAISSDGHLSECRECRRRKASTGKDVKGNPLAKFTARELMRELSLRGYEGTLEFTEVHKIKLGDM